MGGCLVAPRGRYCITAVDQKGLRALKAILAAVIGALALAITGVAAAGPQIGFAEDGTKYANDGGAQLFDEMNKLVTTTNRVAVFWNADAPTTIQDQAFLDRMIPVAQKKNIQVVFAVYPQKATMAPTSQAAADSFCAYAVAVMQRYPYVRKVIIGNEPNQPKFWQPIWNGSQPASPAAMAVVLATRWFYRRWLGGVTGDMIGAGAELVEITVLIALTI